MKRNLSWADSAVLRGAGFNGTEDRGLMTSSHQAVLYSEERRLEVLLLSIPSVCPGEQDLPIIIVFILPTAFTGFGLQCVSD